MIKVRITNARLWYRKCAGTEFEVEEEAIGNGEWWLVVVPQMEGTRRYIRKEDCQVVSSDKPVHCLLDNKHIHWQQGHYIDRPVYKNFSEENKCACEERELLLVRPSPTGNAICQCATPEIALWISQRLNLAALLERKKQCL